MKQELPRYKLVEAAYLKPARSAGASKFEAGATIEFQGVPTFGMAPINAPAVAAKAASIRAYGIGRLRAPSAGDRTALINVTKSINGPVGTVDQMAAFVEQWLSTNPQP